MGDAISIVKENIEAFNEGDFDRFAKTLAEDTVYVEPATHRTAEGRAVYLELAQGWKQSFSDIAGTITNIFDNGNQVVAEINWLGTHDGDMETPGGTIPATGRTTDVKSCAIASVEGGKIKEFHHYFDFMTILSQIGALPEPATA